MSAIAHYRDGTSAKVSGCTWGISSGAACAGVSDAGILTGKDVASESVATVSASYQEGGVRISSEKNMAVLPSVSLGASLNAESTAFRTGSGSEAWVGQKGDSADGISSARCGSCLNASPWIEFALPAGRSLSFACRLSEGRGRNLTIYVNGNAVERFVSTVDMSDWLSWGIEAADLPRTIKVVYQWHGPRDVLAAEGDCAWIDYVNFGDLPPVDELAWGYYIDNGGAVVTEGSIKVSGNVVIPDTLGGCPVVSIGACAFADRADITSVTFPATVTNIGWGAFFDCYGLAEVTLPSSLKSIDGCAFYFTSISEPVLPEGLEYVGDAAFQFSFVKSVLIPYGVRYIGEQAFYGCIYLKSVSIPRSVTVVGSDAFGSDRDLKTVYVSPGDGDRIKGMLAASGLNVDGIAFDDGLAIAPSQNCYGIAFDPGVDGAVWTMPCQSVGVGKVAKLNPCAFTPPAGKRFAGWRRKGTGRRYDDGVMVFNLASESGAVVVLEAVWEDLPE